MKKLIIVSIIALLAPVMVFAANPAATAGAKSGSTVLGGVSSGTIAAGALGVAVVGAAVLSSGGDGSSTSTGSNELPADLQTSLDSLYASLSDAQDARLDYLLVQAASVAEVADVFSSLSDAVAAGATEAEIDAVFADVSAGKAYRIPALQTLHDNLKALFAKDPTIYYIMTDFVGGLGTTQLTGLANVIAKIEAQSSFSAVAAVVQEGGTVVTPTPVHTPSTHVATTHH